jgi:predicted RNA polymerase sigma factor
MARKGSGVILTLSTPGSRLPGPGYIGFGVACAAIEAISRHLAGELGPGARAELLRRLGRPAAAAESYRRALALVSNEAERRHLERRLRGVGA